MDCSIINDNTLEFTKVAIKSVFEQTYDLIYEVIVGDNAPLNGSRKILKKYFGHNIRWIQSVENIGFGRANNLGIAIVQCKNILFLNSDTLLENNTMKILSKLFRCQ